MGDKYWQPMATKFKEGVPNVTDGEVDPPVNDPVWDGMSKKNFMHIGRYVRNVANWIGLRDWRISLSWEPIPEDDDAAASITCTYGQRMATIKLTQHFSVLPPLQQTHMLVHELYHCHLEAIGTHKESLRMQLARSTFELYEDGLRDIIEMATDAIAREVAEMIPPIDSDWPKPYREGDE